ncbi:MAG TPA: hypothetical protein VJL59_05215 [Anaerolineales bacterium]|nr:hypothetical protein [Anaerolineales bacterium]
MNDKIWILARLADDQLRLVREAEQTLGSIQVLVFQPGDLTVAGLNESQIECLHGLEKSLGGLTVVAYQKG